MMVVPRTHTDLVQCAFSVVAPSVWNSVCWRLTMRQHSCNSFKCHLKTFVHSG